MGITWNPVDSTPSVSGSVSCTAGVPDEWLSACKGETITNGVITSTHSSQTSCVVTHVCNPPAPPGMTITDTATGITVSGLVTDVMNTVTSVTYDQDGNIATIQDMNKPAGAILTHYEPLTTDKVTYTITVTATWTYGTGSQTAYVKDWKVTLYNTWLPEKNAVLSLIEDQ